ncbi:MAG: molybdopterin-dependent oxidoreductase [Nitrospirales bacterium]
MDLNRRTFLHMAGLTAAGSVLPGCEREVHRLIPYLLPDDEIVPGVDNWYASICQECHAGCGILVRVMEGRAKKIEGNPTHPVNQGKLCARGQAALQGLYNPDRIRGPLQRDGRRGDGTFKPITWEEGFAIWGAQLRAHQGRTAMVSRPVSGSLAVLMSQFMQAGNGRLVFYDPADSHSLRAANRRCFGIDGVPQYDIAHCDYLLSFGAPFLERWLSPVFFGVAYGHMRQGRPMIRGRFVHLEPRLSLTAANADRWIPIKAGTEGLLALGIGQAMLHEGLVKLSPRDQQQIKPLYARRSLESIAELTDVSRDEIVHLAREFAQAAAPLAIGGGSSCAQTNETMTLMAINALNLLVGNIGREGGVRFFRPAQFPASSDTSRSVSEQTLSRLSEEFTQGRYSLLHLYRTNPLFAVPPSVPIQGMFDRAQFIVSFSSFLDESTAMADLILPDHSPLESWSDHVQTGVVAMPTIGLGQPVVTPLHDTQAIGDVLLEAMRRFLPTHPHDVPAKDFYERLRAQWETLLVDRVPSDHPIGLRRRGYNGCSRAAGGMHRRHRSTRRLIRYSSNISLRSFTAMNRNFRFTFIRILRWASVMARERIFPGYKSSLIR